MKLRKYLLTLMMSMFALVVAPVCAQDEAMDSAETEEVAGEMDEEEADDEEEGKGKKKKKKSKKSKKDKKSAKKGAKKGAKDADDAAEESAAPAVATALGKFKQINGKPNLKADYYIYLCSASWCGYCQACMPVAMEQYKKMKASRKVELIIIGGDKSEKEAVDYLKKYKSKNACIMFSALQATQFQGLPGVGMPGFPSISVVDKDGKMIKNVIGASHVKEVLTNWRELTIGKK